MKKLTFFLVGLITACSSTSIVKTPKNDLLLSVANVPVFADEFIYAFNKNRSPDSVVTRTDIDDYIDLYINFKLKVMEAKERGMDTTSAFKKEFSSYISQLDNSYLHANNDSEELVKEAYERMQIEVRAAHILFAVAESDSPNDTLAAYKNALAVRDSIIGGAPFEKMATKFSTDPSAKQNFGDLGYFSALQMVYPFETAAYHTVIGEISLPIRTKFGYHLIKVIDKKANEGKVKVAHIMIRKGDGDKDKAYDIYDQLMKGADWKESCQKFSEDNQSSKQGGALTPFSRNQIVPEFANAAFLLTTPEEISEPIQTPYGWHIIKLIDKLPVSDFEASEKQIRAQVRRDSRSQISEQKMIERLANENAWIENSENVQLVISPENLNYQNDTLLFEESKLAKLVLFKIKGNPYNARDYYALIDTSAQQKKTKAYLYAQYKKFKEESIINYEKAHLAEKYEEYRFLNQEYFDGILLFSIMEDEVWAKAGKDSLGLSQYYEQHKNEFIDTTKLKVALFSSMDSTIIHSIAMQIPLVKDYKNMSLKEKENMVAQYNGTPQLSLQLDSGEFVIDRHPILQKLALPYSETIINGEKKWYYVMPLRNNNLPIPLKEIKGKLIADYQVVLEERWLAKLKERYAVQINLPTLKNIYKQLEKH